MADTNDHGESLGEWLLAQKGREDAIAGLLAAAKADPKFTRGGSHDDVRKRLNEMQADGGMHSLVDEAETDWMIY